jgi:PKD repeat protein
MVFSALAYKTEDSGDPIHEYIADQASKLYSNAEIDSYILGIMYGARHEDEKDHVWNYQKFLYQTTYTHFWDADKGPDDPAILGYPNAWQKAKILWGMALGEYINGDTGKAYHYLGHMAHLLADMSVPAHAHEDSHADDCYEEWIANMDNATLNPTEKVELKAAGPIAIPYYDDPFDSLYYLFYTTNQIGDFFPSDDYEGDLNDNHGGWMHDIYTDLGMYNITSPRFKADLNDNDIGNNDDDGDLSVIRQYCFMYAIRAVAALYKLFDETTSAESTTTIVIDRVIELDDHDGLGTIPDYFVQVAIGAQWYLNRGDQIENEDFYPRWAFGRDVGTTGTVSVIIKLCDYDGHYFWEDSDIDPRPNDRSLFMWVNLATGDITGDVTGTCGNTIYSSGDQNDASIIGFRILLPNISPAVDAGSDQTVNEGDLVAFSGSFTDPNTGDTHTIEWDFGDGCTTSGTLTPTHTYADDGTYTVTLTITDDLGLSGSDTLSVTVNNVEPTVDAGSDQTVNEGDLVSLGPATFNDKGTLDTHTATIYWGDGTTNDVGSVSESPFGPPGSTAGMDGTVSGTHVYADNGAYTVTVTVTDDDGAATADTITINVNNVAPTLLAGVDQTVNEGDLVYLDPSTFNDKGTLDTHSATINWGDGTSSEPGSVSESPFGPPGSTAGMDGKILGNHVYADNGDCTVTVIVTDDDGAVTSDTFEVTVNNVAPTLDAGSDQTVNEGDLVSLDPATFNDKGTLDTHTATIDWGDGSVVDIGTVNESPFGPPGSTAGMDGTVSGNHVYADNGVYNVTVTVTDDDGAATSDTITITVLNVAPTVDAGVDRTVNEGELVSLDPALFNDKGTLDTHTATIDWGDGSVMDIGTVSESPFGPPGSTTGADGTVSGSHTYGDNGLYTVTVTVTEQQARSGTMWRCPSLKMELRSTMQR